MNQKQTILEAIYKHFIESNDFNGIHLETLIENYSLTETKLISILKRLIKENKISLQFGNESENPFIVRFGHYTALLLVA